MFKMLITSVFESGNILKRDLVKKHVNDHPDNAGAKIFTSSKN